MAFTWSYTIASGERILADAINEIKNNLDSLFSWEGVSWTWQYLPVSAGQIITYNQIKELRDATDYADDHKCKSDYSGYDSSVCSTDNSTVNSSEKSTVNSGHDSGYDSTYYSNVLDYEDTMDYQDNISVHSGYDSSVNSGECGTYHSGYNSSVFYEYV